MIEFILVLLVIFWLIGFLHLSFFSSILFSLASHPFTLHSLLLVILIIAIISLLPGIFRTIAAVILFFWLLSLFGFITIFGLPHILIIILVIAVLFSLF